MAQIKLLNGSLVDASQLGIVETPGYDFPCDKKIATKPFVMNLKLCRVFLNDNKNHPWLILVPRLPVITQNVLGLSDEQYAQLCREKRIVMAAMVNVFKQTEQMNAAEFASGVRQLHMHLIARHTKDIAWPKSVIDSPHPAVPYSEEEKADLCNRLKAAIGALS